MGRREIAMVKSAAIGGALACVLAAIKRRQSALGEKGLGRLGERWDRWFSPWHDRRRLRRWQGWRQLE
jgi:hypothetical protein